MYQALAERDASYEGVFIFAVRTTGVFCRPGCASRVPKPENVAYFCSAALAERAGYRACKRCRPLETKGRVPKWLHALHSQMMASPGTRLSDDDLKVQGLSPERVRRWYTQHFGMSFQRWQRERRLAHAKTGLEQGGRVVDVAAETGFESLSGFAEAFEQLAGKSPKAGAFDKLLRVKQILSPLGPLVAAADDDGLCLLEFADRETLAAQLSRLQRVLKARFVAGEHPVLAKTEEQLAQYFAAERQSFELPLQYAGTEFQVQVWEALRNIAYAETRFYQEQAELLGNPKAVRAVARANGQNALAIVVPCHRVVGKDGKLTGYAGGVWRKQRLLDLEQGRGQIDLALGEK